MGNQSSRVAQKIIQSPMGKGSTLQLFCRKRLANSEKCDIWSIGVVSFMLLTGKPPFDGKNDREILRNVRKGIANWDLLELTGVSKSA